MSTQKPEVSDGGPLKVNGKFYPLWSQFVHRKSEWLGRRLQDGEAETVITDIRLTPNGDDSAFFSVVGKDFTCGFDVKFGGITDGETGWLTFSGYNNHMWRIESPTRSHEQLERHALEWRRKQQHNKKL